jgi:microtubule-associated protein-like 6
MGIWPDGSFAAQMDSLSRSRSQEYAVTGDHFSGVKLFNYPCVFDDAPHRRYRGHASYVTCSRFTADDKMVITTGGADKCIFQWRTSGIAEEDSLDSRKKNATWCASLSISRPLGRAFSLAVLGEG